MLPGSTGRFFKDDVAHNHSAHGYNITFCQLDLGVAKATSTRAFLFRDHQPSQLPPSPRLLSVDPHEPASPPFLLLPSTPQSSSQPPKIFLASHTQGEIPPRFSAHLIAVEPHKRSRPTAAMSRWRPRLVNRLGRRNSGPEARVVNF